MPENQFIDGVIKYKPNQHGIYRVRNEIPSEYRINANGWNSFHKHYDRDKHGKYRIAVIGDSYVEALNVDYRRSTAEQLESMLGDRFEVYRFGISAAPFSQYYQMLRREALTFDPDLVIISLVHNDFDESYKFHRGRFTSSFLKLHLEHGAVKSEIEPMEYKESRMEWLRHSALFRYLFYQRQFNATLEQLKIAILKDPRFKEPQYQANVDISGLKSDFVNDMIATDYLMDKIKSLSAQRKFRILFMMDGDRQSIYEGAHSKDLYEKGVLKLNSMVKGMCDRYEFPFIDLHPVFERDYDLHRRRFDSPVDGHWNEYAHTIVAKTLFQYLTEHEYGP